MNTTPQHPGGSRRAAFTLMELMVSVGVILLLAAIAIPTSVSLMGSGSESQTYNIFAAQCAAARSLALERNSYALVHVQIAEPNLSSPGASKVSDACFSAVMAPPLGTSNGFSLAEGFQPQRMPGTIALGQLSTTYVDASSHSFSASNLSTTAGLFGFTTFNILFAPDGSLATQINGADIVVSSSHSLFAGASSIWGASRLTAGPGAIGAVLFDYSKVMSGTGQQRADYLGDYGEFVPFNVYTGMLLPRQ